MKSTILLSFLLTLIMLLGISNNNVSAQRRYAGSRHASSHGGHYSGGRSSSHKGGSYRNARTGNHYGHHRR